LAALVVGQQVQCVITDITDFGLFAAVGPVEGLIRAAELDRPIHGDGDGAYHIGDRLEAEITEIRPDRGQLTLSRRFVANEAMDRQLADLAVGDVVDTVVTSVAPMGAFVTFRGVTGLVHRSELSWTGDVDSAYLVLGSHHPAEVIKIDRERRRVNLSFRQLTDDPMPGLLAGLTLGGRVTGVVTGVVNFGAFVELSAGVDGLIHYTELPRPVETGAGDDGVRSQVAEGSSVLARVLSIDAEKRRVSLTLRDPHPWLDGIGLPPVGAQLSGTVAKVAEDGIRVVVLDRLLGVISWPDAVDLDGAPTVDSTIDVVVVGLDREQRKLILEAVQTDPVD
ncbi:MAG TPA: S1 RNA-binding domain-containing protein, partial [Actinomycetes bacterium]|nr:S1 RNA-binding domain-containing protein [Actinomycetes bacterium]